MPAGGDGNPRRERQTGIPVGRKPADGVSLRPRAPELYVYPGTRRVPLPPEDGNDNFTVL